MNGEELQYARHLEVRRLGGELHSWTFQAIKYRIGDGTWYLPDFHLIVLPEMRLEVHEWKGRHWEDKGRVKIKAAAGLYPWICWYGVQKTPRSGYKFEHFKTTASPLEAP
jgi:hypothetical protein